MTNADVLVVGGGIIGLSIARKALLDGRSVKLFVDPLTDTTSASLAAGAMLGAFAEITFDKTSPVDKEENLFRIRSSEQYPQWLADISKESGKSIFQGMGTFIIANTFGKNDLNNLNYIESQLQEFGKKYSLADEKDIPGYHPNERYVPRRVLFLPEEGYVDTADLSLALQLSLQNYSNFSFHCTRITRIIEKEGRITGIVDLQGEEFFAPYVVLAGGVGTAALLESCQTQKISFPGLMPGKGASLIVSADQKFPHVLRSPNRDFACGLHIVPRAGGKIYIGATNRTAFCPGTKEGASLEEVHDLLHQAMHEFSTRLDSAILETVRYGQRPISLDGVPLIGETEVEGLIVATGTYRNGVLMAPRIAEVVCDIIHSRTSLFDNPFQLRNRQVRKETLYDLDFLRRGASGIVSFLPQPHGHLPYQRSEELTNFIGMLLSLCFGKEAESEQILEEARLLLEKRPLQETFAQLFFELSDRMKAQSSLKDLSR